MNRKKLTFEFVYNYFKEHDCKLLETEYIDAHTKMKYICSCGNPSEISWSNFKSGYRCKECGIVKKVIKQKHTYEYVKSEFEKNGCTLLSKEYVANNQLLDYICVCGNKAKITWATFQAGSRCYECRNKKISKALTQDYEEIVKLFEDNGCILLTTKEEYKNK